MIKTELFLQQYNESKLLQNNLVLDIANDQSQNLWLGLSNGVSKTERMGRNKRQEQSYN